MKEFVITKNWPDDVRLKMIEKSELYKPNQRIYQYGYYDGYQKAKKEFAEILAKVDKNIKSHIYFSQYTDFI